MPGGLEIRRIRRGDGMDLGINCSLQYTLLAAISQRLIAGKTHEVVDTFLASLYKDKELDVLNFP